MANFQANRSPRERLRAVRHARAHRAVPLGVLQALQAQVDAGNITIMQPTDVHEMTLLPNGVLHVSLKRAIGMPEQPHNQAAAGSEEVSNSTPHAASGSPSSKLQEGPASGEQQRLAQPMAPCSGAAGHAAGTTSHQESDAFTPDPAQPPMQPLHDFWADVTWTATGEAYSALADPVLATLQQACPTRIVGGYPMVDDETLAWPGLPLHLLGRGASLSLGPAAGAPPPQRQMTCSPPIVMEFFFTKSSHLCCRQAHADRTATCRHICLLMQEISLQSFWLYTIYIEPYNRCLQQVTSET